MHVHTGAGAKAETVYTAVFVALVHRCGGLELMPEVALVHRCVGGRPSALFNPCQTNVPMPLSSGQGDIVLYPL